MELFPDDLLWRIIAYLTMVGIIVFLVNSLLRKLLNVKRKQVFSYNYVNDFHKKGDRLIRVLSVLAIFLLLIFNMDPIFLSLIMVSLVSGILQDGLRAVLEKRYAENQNDYLFTLAQLPSSLIIVFGLAWLMFPFLIADLLNIIK
ncbi:DUF4181 domain-containing protein [Planomicrobium sp. CPCC 101079]|uniref:DUF4181 domain-containing protein n=1 Tax=Planomicrobium sp. CPCC 101079 TaxID=2599618 RepID=UPI0011B66A33|nr:DUF4181 domain-containing protein [Planomicrobium sp. CPCC 101079]TWT13213.1 DUF4181 domain-containing protein [Planomicrobium sp. CPCC 101079]